MPPTGPSSSGTRKGIGNMHNHWMHTDGVPLRSTPQAIHTFDRKDYL